MISRAYLFRWGCCLLVVGGLASASIVLADDDALSCRIAFDVGSSGIRAGTSNSALVGRAEVDYLSALWEKRTLLQTLPATSEALRSLPIQAGFDPSCVKVAGGFSAWRLALHYDPEALAGDLAWLKESSDAPLIVIPQRIEGQYGYRAAQAALGDRLQTTHVLDIGGGSLQVAGEKTAFGAILGQKVWHRDLCALLAVDGGIPCNLQPLSPEDLANSRQLAKERLRGLVDALAEGVTLTAISRPVTQGILPALVRMEAIAEGEQTISIAALQQAIDQLAVMSRQAMETRLALSPRFSAYLLSDMILLEGIMQVSGTPSLAVAEADLTNVPGLLADDAAYSWARHYECYLERLRQQGVDAYFSDPATCSATNPMPGASE